MPPWVVVVALICAVIGLFVGNPKGHPVWGLFLGLLLGPIGIIVIACAKEDREHAVRREQARLRVQAEAQRREGQAVQEAARTIAGAAEEVQ
jgi:hypothetical protein